MGLIHAAYEEIDPPGEGEPDDRSDAVPGQVFPRRIAQTGEVGGLLGDAAPRGNGAAEEERMTARVEDRSAGRISAGGDTRGDTEVKGLVAAQPRIVIGRPS